MKRFQKYLQEKLEKSKICLHSRCYPAQHKSPEEEIRVKISTFSAMTLNDRCTREKLGKMVKLIMNIIIFNILLTNMIDISHPLKMTFLPTGGGNSK